MRAFRLSTRWPGIAFMGVLTKTRQTRGTQRQPVVGTQYAPALVGFWAKTSNAAHLGQRSRSRQCSAGVAGHKQITTARNF